MPRRDSSPAPHLAVLNPTLRTSQVGLPAMDYPMHYKRNATGHVVTGIGELYFDDSVPWEGSMIDYLDALLAISPFAGFNFTFASGYARVVHDSKWTATVHDVSHGLLRMGGSDFWVTTQRSERRRPAT